MTSPISNDGLMTQLSTPRGTEAPKDARDTAPGAEQTDDRGATADVERAQQRLTQESAQSNGTVPGDAEQATALAAMIKRQLTEDPAAALRAVDNATETLFEAATARPTA